MRSCAWKSSSKSTTSQSAAPTIASRVTRLKVQPPMSPGQSKSQSPGKEHQLENLHKDEMPVYASPEKKRRGE